MLAKKLDTSSRADSKISLIGPLSVMRLNRIEAVELVQAALEQRAQLDIAICNAHTALTAFEDADYAAVLGKMTLLNDGIGVNLANKILHGVGFPDNLNGTDLVPFILENIDRPLRIYLLGAKDTQVNLAKVHLEKTYPAHVIVGHRNGYVSEADCPDVCAKISAVKPDLLLVAMGNPRQERFIVENRHHLDVGVTIGVGALFDFLSGSVARAPSVIRAIGLEWLFRLAQEPRRLVYRYAIGIPKFLIVILKLKFGLKPLRS
ncbi:MAG: WecB/TagA/CpsF family glycosyltransferase [Roseibium sp.]